MRNNNIKKNSIVKDLLTSWQEESPAIFIA